MSCLSPAKEYAHAPSTIKRMLKIYFGTRTFCHMSQDVRTIRCQITQVPLYNILFSYGNCMLKKNLIQLVLMSDFLTCDCCKEYLYISFN